MKKWGIITDSSCDLTIENSENSQIHFANVPFKMNIGTREYIDNDELKLGAMIDDMETAPEICRTSCPAPASWLEHYEQCNYNIAIAISSRLSGSYASACAAKQMFLEMHPEKEVFVLDSASAGSALSMCLEKAKELIESGADFTDAVTKLKEYKNSLHTIFALCSFKNLVKNGRMSRFSGFIAGTLGIWGIGVAKEGEIAVKSKVRGPARVLNAFIDDMTENGFTGGRVTITHCQNEDLAQKLKARVLDKWSNSDITILPAKGLCSFYAERRGLIVAY